MKDLFSLAGRTALITGGSRGIGRMIAEGFLHQGARVYISARKGGALEETAKELSKIGPCTAIALDASGADGAKKMAEAYLKHEKTLDILVNNAGRVIRRPSLELALDDWNAVVAVNMTGVFLCARAAAGQMIKSGFGGAIVNTASILGLSGGGLYPNISYQTTKGAVVNMTRALAVEWAPHKIRVNAVAPTWTRTAFIGELEQNPDLMRRIREVTPLGRLAEPEEVAHAIAFLASPGAAMITGHTLAVDGGFLAQ